MRSKSTFKLSMCLGMSLFISNAPQVALAETQSTMISNRTLIYGDSETQAQDLQNLLEKKEVLAQLNKLGVSAEEAKARIAGLSAAELQQFSSQVEQARAGGNILVTVVLVLLIVFLIQRI